MPKRKHVAVLLGGMSSEREVSLRSGKAVVDALKKLGHKVTEIDALSNVAEKIKSAKPDIVFNALHGTYGEDGCIPGMLEIMGIPYTHSGVLASAMAMHKSIAKRFFEAVGIPCAEEKIVTAKDFKKGDPMKRPFVIKPVSDGSSVGVLVVKKGDAINPRKLAKGELLVERYIPGVELSVAVLDGKALGAIEIRPKQGFYDYRNKYTAGMTEYIIPAPVPQKIIKICMDYAERAHAVLGCRGVSRSDFRYDNTKGGDGKVYILEINTHPGMTQLSLVPKIANYCGKSFEAVVAALIDAAQCDNVPAYAEKN